MAGSPQRYTTSMPSSSPSLQHRPATLTQSLVSQLLLNLYMEHWKLADSLLPKHLIKVARSMLSKCHIAILFYALTILSYSHNICLSVWFIWQLSQALHYVRCMLTSGVSAGQIMPHCVLCSCLGLASLPSLPIGELRRRKWDSVEANVNLFNTCKTRTSILL